MSYARIPCAHCGEPICSNNTRRHAIACEKRIAAAKMLADPAFREKFNGLRAVAFSEGPPRSIVFSVPGGEPATVDVDGAKR